MKIKHKNGLAQIILSTKSSYEKLTIFIKQLDNSIKVYYFGETPALQILEQTVYT